MLLFWQKLKNIFKQKIQLTIFVILITLSVLLITSSWIVNMRLTSSYSFMGQGNFNYDYLLKLDSKKKTGKNVKTITPWFAFSNDYHLITDINSKQWTLPYVHLGDDGALKKLDKNIEIKFTFNNKTNKIIDINFTDNNKNALNFLNNGLYRFNFQNKYFKNSIIGKLYDQNGRLFDQNNLNLIEEFMNNFTHSDISKNTINLIISYLNEKFSKIKNENELKKEIIEFVNCETTNKSKKWKKNVDLRKNEEIAKIPEETKIKYELFKNKLKGDLSFLTKNTLQSLTKINLYYSPTINDNIDVGYNNNIQNAVFSINDFYNKKNKNNNFKNNPYGPYGLTKSYFSLVAKSSNFSFKLYEQYTYWDLATNLKYKIINWQELLKNNELKFIKKYVSFNPNDPINNIFIIIIPQFAHNQKLKIGDKFTIGENSNFFVGGIGGDTANIYPSIYDTDVFFDPKTDGVVYVSSDTYQNESIVSNNDIEENSTLYINHIGSAKNKIIDTENFKRYLACDFLKLNNSNYKNSPIQSKDETKLIYLRYSLLGTIIKFYRIITIILIIVFLIILIFTLIILIKKIINQQKNENGILKANGYSNLIISFSYLSYSLIITIIGVPIGWIVGVLLQFPIMSIFNNYFVIPSIFSFSFITFIICFIIIFFINSLSILITAICQLTTKPLDLINPNKNIKNIKLINFIKKNINFKKFITKLRLIILAISIKKISWFFLTFFIASMSLTFATLIPTTINKFSKDYYLNLNYNNEYKYANVVGNIPFSRYQIYDWNGINYSNDFSYPLSKNSLISDYLYNGKWLSTKNDINYQNSNLYAQQINNMIIFNFMVGKGASLSIGTFYDMYVRYGKNSDIRNKIDTLLCSIMPNAFGKKSIYPNDNNIIDRWTYCVQYATNSIMPGKIKTMWLKNKLNKLQFNFTFGTLIYNAEKEDLYTGYQTNILNSNFIIPTYGINSNNKTIIFPNISIKEILNNSKNLNITKDVIPIIINKAAKNKFNLSLNEIIETTTNIKQLQCCNNNYSIPPTAWSYESPKYFYNNNYNPFTIDLTKLTINNKDRVGFKNKNGIIEDYYNVKNFVLKLPISIFNSNKFKNKTISITTGNDLPGLLNIDNSNQKIITKKGNYYIIHPFDNKFDKEINGIIDLTKGFPTNWYQEAFRQGLLKIETIAKKVKYKIIGIQNSYDKPRAYVNQIIANKILDFNTNYSQLYNNKVNNPLLWFNGKFSKYQDQADQITRFNISSSNGSYSINEFMNGKFTNSIEDADYLIIKSQIISKLSWILSILSIIFVIITIITVIIIIYIITESFVNLFLKFISVIKSLGYSNYEINSLILGIFFPFSLLSWILGISIMWTILWIGIYGFITTVKIIIPFVFPWITIPITFILIVGIYLLTYWISICKIKHMNIQKQILSN